MAWYTQVRRQFVDDPFPLALYEGLVQTLDVAINERVKRFVAFCEKTTILYSAFTNSRWGIVLLLD